MNKVTLSGFITKVNGGHEYYGEKYLHYVISVKRLSGTEDEIPVIVSERFKWASKLTTGMEVTVIGEFRSCNKDNRHNLYVFASEVYEMVVNSDVNIIDLDGYICKQPIIRETPLGRVITDFMLAVNRTCGRTDYIPCVSWGRIAKYVKDVEIGEQVSVTGRIQSREYVKNGSTYVTYEVSINDLKVNSSAC